MMRRAFPKTVFVLGLGTLLWASSANAGQGAGPGHQRAPSATTPHFAFFNDFATNLNDALIAAGVARTKGKPELFHSGEEASCFDELPPSAQAGWDRAVDYYAEIISPLTFNDRQQYLLRMHLAGFDEELKDPGARQFIAMAGNFRATARPTYEACRWSAQEAANARWIEEVGSQLAVHEQKLARRLADLYKKPWDGLPIPVDVVATVSWSGANSIMRDPVGGHLLISSTFQGPAALEIIFHESSHLFMGREDPLQKALGAAAEAQGRTLPRDLWHVVLFYTTGEAVRRRLEDEGHSGYTPMIYDIFDRNRRWARFRGALESTWPAYLDGKRTLSEAATDLIEAVGTPGEP